MDDQGNFKHSYIQMDELKEQMRYRPDSANASLSPSPLASPLPSPLYMETQDQNVSQPPLLKAWLLEIVAWVVSLASLFGICSILRHYDDKPMPNFPFGITLNAAVSVLTQILTICCGHVTSEVLGQTKWIWYGSSRQRPLSDFKLFDDAVRGPLGAASLLLTPRIFMRSVAAASCILVITTLAIGPFMQQLITYVPRTVPYAPVNTTAPSIPRSTYYNAYLPGSIMALKTPDLAFKAAFYNGLYNSANPSMYSITAECSTGNCTWPIFSSLGVCSTCVDSTDDIIENCSEAAFNSTSCNYTMPGDYSPVIATSLGQTTAINITQYYNTTGAAGRLPTYNSTLSRLSIMLAVGVAGDYNVSSYTCSLYVCAKAYKDFMSSGNLTEQVLATFPDADTTADEAAASVIAERDGEGSPNVTIIPSDNSIVSDSTIPSFSMATVSLTALGNYMGNLFIGSGSSSVGEYSFEGDIQQVLYLAHEDADLTENALPEDQGYAVGYVMESIATSLTNTIRSDMDSSGTYGFTGEAWTVTTYIHVDWSWILLPAIVLLLTLLSLLFVMYKSWRAQIPYFKSSTLPALFLQIPGSPPASDAPHESELTVNNEVKSIKSKMQLLALQRAMDGYLKTGR